jgi:LysM repeat protein
MFDPRNLKGEDLMKDDPELKINDNRSDDGPHTLRRRRVESGSSKSLRILLVILLILIFGGGILYFLVKRPAGGEANLLQSKVTALEQRVAGLERQLADLQGKVGTPGRDPILLQRVDALSQKVDALEREKQPTAESKAKPSASSKPVASTEKQYHTVRKGETLYGIGKKYGISVEQLRKLNNLSSDQLLRRGQKLLVSPRH